MTRHDGKRDAIRTGKDAPVAGNADRDAQVDAPAGGAGADTGKADPAAEGSGVGTGGTPIPEIGGKKRTDAAAGPGTDGTVVPGNMPRTGRPNATQT